MGGIAIVSPIDQDVWKSPVRIPGPYLLLYKLLLKVRNSFFYVKTYDSVFFNFLSFN